VEDREQPLSFVVRILRRWAAGFGYPFQGGRFILKNHGLLLYVLLPTAINIAVWALVFGIGFSYYFDWLNRLVPRGQTWYWAAVFIVLSVLFGLLILLAMVYLFAVVGNILSSPFNDALSQRVEELLTGDRMDQRFSVRAMIREGRQAVIQEAKRIAFFLAVVMALALLNLLPIVGTALNLALGALATLLFLAIEYVGYIMDRRHLGLKARLSIVRSNLGLMLGFGCGVFILLLIPLINLLCIPASVVGGTMLGVKELLAGKGHGETSISMETPAT
jgi:CysZ protein